MEKLVVVFLFLFGSVWRANCQTASAMLKQIAALQVYIADAKRGYKIAEDGLHTIGDIKNGEFNLHSAFFNSLKTVSPSVRNMVEVSEIIALQVAIVHRFSQSLDAYQQGSQFSSDELKYIGRVYSVVVTAGLKDLEDLTAVITDGQLEMDDGARIRRIREIHKDMQEQWSFTSRFTGQSDLLELQQSRDLGDVLTAERLYGLY